MTQGRDENHLIIDQRIVQLHATPPPKGGSKYLCPSCLRHVPGWFGADDDMPDLCDDCWYEAQRNNPNPVKGGQSDDLYRVMDYLRATGVPMQAINMIDDWAADNIKGWGDVE